MIPIYDLMVPHVIKVLYVMMLISSYGTFFMLHYLVNNQDVGADPHLVRKFKAFDIFFSISYSILLVTGFIPKIGANCTNEITYRKNIIPINSNNSLSLPYYCCLVHYSILHNDLFLQTGFLEEGLPPIDVGAAYNGFRCIPSWCSE